MIHNSSLASVIENGQQQAYKRTDEERGAAVNKASGIDDARGHKEY
jgi:hypothetical protein